MLRGYDYGPQFQSIYKADLIGTGKANYADEKYENQKFLPGKKALIKWNGYWSSFLDAVTQLGLLLYKGDTLFFAHHIDYCAIDPVKHKSFITESGKTELKIQVELMISLEF